jgi:cellulose synthase/poly-beta-1,6-N-acetylglucosamine synthase-like glycosyltransferase
MTHVFLEALYVSLIVLLTLYGCNSLILTAIYWLSRFGGRRTEDDGRRPKDEGPLPSVTVQLPIYNEVHTIERLLAAVTALDYPSDRLEVQVLDDSDDATVELAAQLVAQYRACGFNVVHLHRDRREGFKAGALAAGLAQAQGEFIAIFDADFVPPPDFLRRTLPTFADPRVGCVEARWGHLNPDYSLLTQAQAVLLDAHFVVEQPARQASGAFISFNGSGGIWRRRCLEEVGWSADTITEDLDITYRAQLAGWRVVFMPDLVVPGELPVQMDAFKRQQFRWAKGAIQTLRKLGGPLLRSRQPLWVKGEGLLHLSLYFMQPVTLLILLLAPLIAWSGGAGPRALSWAWLATLGPFLLIVSSQLGQQPRPMRRLLALPVLLLLGAGLSLVNTLAVVEALLGRPNRFERTPKFNVRAAGEEWRQSGYALRHSPLAWVELGLSAFAGLSALAMLAAQKWALVPWMLIYMAGFAWVAGQSLLQSWRLTSFLAPSHLSPCPSLMRGGEQGEGCRVAGSNASRRLSGADDLMQPLKVHVPAGDNGHGQALGLDPAAEERGDARGG